MTEVISVRFRGGCKSYFFDPGQLKVAEGQNVVVETAQGHEFGTCSEGNHMVSDTAVVQPLRPVLRIATANDQNTVEYNRRREREAFDICEKKILEHKLDMKLVRVEYSFDGNKILFFFTADGRVDFRELVKNLAGIFHARIELRQIGVRDETKMLGGLGICGRPLCCSDFLEEFLPVSIKMAKTQNLSLNPTKISGACGRLMCCLKYEQDAYEDAVKRMPKNDSFVLTPDGPGDVCEVNLLKEEVKVRLDIQSDSPKCYKNCEVCVLRNGKGSREGVTIPDRWPQRYVKPAEEEITISRSYSTPSYSGGERLSALFEKEEPVVAQEEKQEGSAERSGSRRRRRGGRGRGGNKGQGAQSSAPAQKSQQPAEKSAEKRQQKPRPEKKGEGKGKAERDGKVEVRSVASHSPSQIATAENKPVIVRADGEAPARKPRHRGGRRRRGGSGRKTEGGKTE